MTRTWTEVTTSSVGLVEVQECATAVHLIDEAEVDRIAGELGLEVTERYYADGHSNDLTLYAILV